SATLVSERKERQRIVEGGRSTSPYRLESTKPSKKSVEQVETTIRRSTTKDDDGLDSITKGMKAMTLAIQAQPSTAEIVAEVLKQLQKLPNGMLPVQGGVAQGVARNPVYSRDDRRPHFQTDQDQSNRSRRNSSASGRSPLLCFLCAD